MLWMVRPGRRVWAGMMKAGCLVERENEERRAREKSQKKERRVERRVRRGKGKNAYQRPRMSLGASSVSQLGNLLNTNEAKKITRGVSTTSPQRRVVSKSVPLENSPDLNRHQPEQSLRIVRRLDIDLPDPRKAAKKGSASTFFAKIHREGRGEDSH